MMYKIQSTPYRVPSADGKLIEEFFGKASIDCTDCSFARMIAPPGWIEPYQTPEFDEITYIISGKKQFELDNKTLVLEQNQSICVKKGTRVRYSNPFDKPVEYISVCLPAFTFEKVNRDSPKK